MNTLESRVSSYPRFQLLSRQLQCDMLESAKVLRNLIYDIKGERFYSVRTANEIQNALEILDFPHFVPIDDTTTALAEEYERLRELVWSYAMTDYRFNRIARQFMDVEAELDRRGWFAKTEVCKACGNLITCDWVEVAGMFYCSHVCLNWFPVDNTSEALYAEYVRLEPLYLNSEHGLSHAQRDAVRIQMDDIWDELHRREFFGGTS